MYKVLVLVFAVVAVTALPASNEKNGNEDDPMATMYSDCLKKESVSCIKYKVFSFVDKMLADKDDITLSDGVTVIKTSNAEEGAPRHIEGTDIDTLLFDRLGRFLRTHTVKVDLKGSDILGVVESAGRSLEDISDSVGDARGKKKKAAKILGPLLMIMALKMAALIPLAMGAIALIAGKALLIGKIALLISAIIGLKKLLGGQQKTVTYEVVSHPHHSSSHVSHDDPHGGGGGGYSSGPDFGGYGGGGGGSSGHGWARSLPQDVETAQDIAYRAYVPQPARYRSSSSMGHFPRYVVLALFIAIASARSPELDGNSIEDSGRSSNGVFGDIQYVYQIYKECSSADLSSCLKLKLIGAMDRISRSLDINLSDGITLTKDNGLDAEPLTKSEREIEADLPRALEEKEDALNSIILDKVVNFFRSHTLKLKLPNIDELQRSFTEEGRKKKKMGELMAIPLLIGGTLIPLALGALALLAGKALIVSKLALVLASIIGLKKLVSGGGDGGGHEVVQVAGGHGSSGWARSSHDIAYSAYKPHSA
ncbi:uncharacterized protein LOC124310245 [Neodiprion virginianus]|uniref:uncharacterized protein LOC124310245 n=1 Tax=Neodiprion virginianus TaxID=2961670 RepID=UPI001EE73C36|nr:uncharacterized protein LOC124310245 [Neodiprion virginianus]